MGLWDRLRKVLGRETTVTKSPTPVTSRNITTIDYADDQGRLVGGTTVKEEQTTVGGTTTTTTYKETSGGGYKVTDRKINTTPSTTTTQNVIVETSGEVTQEMAQSDVQRLQESGKLQPPKETTAFESGAGTGGGYYYLSKSEDRRTPTTRPKWVVESENTPAGATEAVREGAIAGTARLQTQSYLPFGDEVGVELSRGQYEANIYETYNARRRFIGERNVRRARGAFTSDVAKVQEEFRQDPENFAGMKGVTKIEQGGRIVYSLTPEFFEERQTFKTFNKRLNDYQNLYDEKGYYKVDDKKSLAYAKGQFRALPKDIRASASMSEANLAILRRGESFGSAITRFNLGGLSGMRTGKTVTQSLETDKRISYRSIPAVRSSYKITGQPIKWFKETVSDRPDAITKGLVAGTVVLGVTGATAGNVKALGFKVGTIQTLRGATPLGLGNVGAYEIPTTSSTRTDSKSVDLKVTKLSGGKYTAEYTKVYRGILNNQKEITVTSQQFGKISDGQFKPTSFSNTVITQQGYINYPGLSGFKSIPIEITTSYASLSATLPAGQVTTSRGFPLRGETAITKTATGFMKPSFTGSLTQRFGDPVTLKLESGGMSVTQNVQYFKYTFGQASASGQQFKISPEVAGFGKEVSYDVGTSPQIFKGGSGSGFKSGGGQALNLPKTLFGGTTGVSQTQATSSKIASSNINSFAFPSLLSVSEQSNRLKIRNIAPPDIRDITVTRTKTKQLFNVPVDKSRYDFGTGTGSRTNQRVDQILNPVTISQPVTGGTGGGFTSPTTPTQLTPYLPAITLPFPWALPARTPKTKGVRASRTFKYTPSYKAIIQNIKGKLPKQKRFTGLEVRPIPIKKRSIKRGSKKK